MHTQACTHVHTCTCIHLHAHTCTHTCVHTHVHTYIHVHYTRGLTYIRTRVCTHTQSAHILSRGWPSPQLTPEMLQSSARVPAEMGSSPSGVFVSRAPSVGMRASGRAGRGAWLSWNPEAKGSSLLPPFTHPAFMRLCKSSAWQTGCRRDGQQERRAPDEAKINGQSWAVMRTQGRKAQGV